MPERDDPRLKKLFPAFENIKNKDTFSNFVIFNIQKHVAAIVRPENEYAASAEDYSLISLIQNTQPEIQNYLEALEECKSLNNDEFILLFLNLAKTSPEAAALLVAMDNKTRPLDKLLSSEEKVALFSQIKKLNSIVKEYSKELVR